MNRLPRLYVRDGKKPYDGLYEAFTVNKKGERKCLLRTCRLYLIRDFAITHNLQAIYLKPKGKSCPSK